MQYFSLAACWECFTSCFSGPYFGFRDLIVDYFAFTTPFQRSLGDPICLPANHFLPSWMHFRSPFDAYPSCLIGHWGCFHLQNFDLNVNWSPKHFIIPVIVHLNNSLCLLIRVTAVHFASWVVATDFNNLLTGWELYFELNNLSGVTAWFLGVGRLG